MPLIPKQQPPYYEPATTSPTLSIKYYTALLSQASALVAPTATILQNTLSGTLVWTREAQGIYYATLAGEFPELKTYIPPFENGSTIMIPISKNSIADYYYTFNWLGDDELQLMIFDETYTNQDIFTAIGVGKISLPTVSIYP